MRADVGAHVVPEAIVDGDDGPVAAHARDDLVVLLARVVGGLQVLATILDPPHGPPGADRQERHEEVFRVHLAPDAEGAAHVRLQEVHAVLGQPGMLGDDAPVDVRHLGHAPHAEHAAARIPLGEGAARLQGHAGVSLHVKRSRRTRSASRRRLVDVAAGDGVGRRPRSSLRTRRAIGAPGSAGRSRVHEHRERSSYVHLHRGQRVLGPVAVVGHDGGHRLADVADLVVRQRALQVAAHLGRARPAAWGWRGPAPARRRR